MSDDLVERAYRAFEAEAQGVPPMTLRAGNALDEYRIPPPCDPSEDRLCDAYLEGYHWGIAFLDPVSWRHYLPHLIEYVLRHEREGSEVGDALLWSLRPPDREPPRLALLSPEQEKVVSDFLDRLAFDEGSAHRDLARIALEEWWAPGALYRPPREG